jgi:hypothetical protein
VGTEARLIAAKALMKDGKAQRRTVTLGGTVWPTPVANSSPHQKNGGKEGAA